MSILMNNTNQQGATAVRFFTVIVMGVFLAACLPSLSWALGIDLEEIPKVVHYDAPSENDFKKEALKIEESKPYGDELLGYQFYLPKGWSENLQVTPTLDIVDGQKSKDISDTIFSMMGKYVGKPNNLQRSFVTIEGQKLGYEVKALHWFVSQILTNGLSLSAVTEISDKEVEGLYVQMEKDTSYVVRAYAIINGNKLLIIRHFLPQENYEAEKVEQEKIVSSFKALKKSDAEIEEQKTFGFLDQSYFNYPASWRLKEKPILTVERMSALLYQERLNREQLVLEGHVRVNAISRLLKTRLSEEVKSYKTTLKIPAYKIGKRIEKVTFDRNPTITLQETEIYELVPDDLVNMRPYELLVSVMQSNEYYYIISMISPSRDHDFYGWARNKEAAKIMIESIRRYKETSKVDAGDSYYNYLKTAQ